jgi:hypothetical protein
MEAWVEQVVGWLQRKALWLAGGLHDIANNNDSQ